MTEKTKFLLPFCLLGQKPLEFLAAPGDPGEERQKEIETDIPGEMRER